MVEHSDVGENEGKQAQLIAAETFTNVLKGDADGSVKSVIFSEHPVDVHRHECHMNYPETTKLISWSSSK